MRLLLCLIFVILFAILLGSGTGFLLGDAANKSAAWYPEREVASKEDLQKRLIVINPEAKAFVETDVFDFGVLDRSREGRHDFVVENHGSDDLTLTVNRTSCTCTGVDVSEKVVKPGGKSIITVHWKSDTPSPTFKQGASILTNDPEMPEIFFTVKGLFTSPVMVEPGMLVFPPINIGRDSQSSFRVYGFEKQPLELNEIRFSDTEHFEVATEPAELNAIDRADPIFQKATNVLQVNVKVKPGLPLGSYQERLLLITNYEKEPELEFFVKGNIVAGNISIGGRDFNRETGVLNAGRTTILKPLVSQFTVRYTGIVPENADLKVVQVEPPFMKITVEKLGGTENAEEAAARRSLAFVCKAEIMSETPGSWNGPDPKNMGFVEFETGLPETPTLRIPIQFSIDGN